ncbi:ABC transporter ATP-binding protein [Paenibacillus donghaensis]|uniref:Bacitracin ABC transporter ATP-binding protein n=1 Tax=Paenibacillus donghaensis TaxID=414771 RepID=A0A2Z2KEZ4_9BACL|nr:ABC transporter ATP-binding protein [Paenibacillus donghaensis]ASA21683.1 bacitracin ABC transporter ATP-binding protein [Paenibacillus donghaensis]
MKEMIRTVNLTKRYGDKTIVDNVSLSVNKGEIYGFLGLNGAGKTTTIRTLLGMIRPTSGDVYLYGKRLAEGGQDLWKRVGYMVEMPYAYPSFSVRDNLKLFARLRGISDQRAIDEVMDKINLTSYAKTKAKDLSLGNAQKLGLAKALIHNPDILILDEPTNALDPVGIVEIRGLLKRLASEHGVTVFISSHILEEISKLASRIGIIHQGVLLQEITAQEFDRIRQKRLYMDACDKGAAAMSRLVKEGYQVQLSDKGLLVVADERAVRHPEVIARLLIREDIPLSLLKVEEEDLESYFLKIVGANGGQGQ